MPVAANEIMELLSNLANEERLRVTVTQAVRGGLIAGGMAVAGGLLGGPIGMAVCGSAGACVAAATSNEFKSVVTIIATMEPCQKEILAERVREIMNNFNATDLVVFSGLVGGNVAIRQEVVNALINYVTTDMGMVLADR